MKAKKSLGQNFLSDPNVLESIVAFSGVTPGAHVLEIGPGRGALTQVLLKAGAKVRAVEIDPSLFAFLQEQFGQNPNVSLVSGDILQMDIANWYLPAEPFQVVANIPYYITAPIIKKLLTAVPAPARITLLVQKEVAERLAGGAKHRSVLTVATQYYSYVELGPIIPKSYFDPIPKVDSQLVALVPYRTAQEGDQEFFRVVRAGFAARRKTLFNNLVAARLASKERIQNIFTELEWPITRRAQDLEVVEWLQLQTKLFG